MNSQKQSNYSVHIGGDVSGQVSVGSNNSQIATIDKPSSKSEETLDRLPPAPRHEMASVCRFLNQHFNLDELRELAFDLGIDYENVEGTSKRAKIRELVLYFNRQHMLDELIKTVKERRPWAPW
ncbi:MAG TPA: hypothetical protein VF177_10345 [Anaerolineae bacterium]